MSESVNSQSNPTTAQSGQGSSQTPQPQINLLEVAITNENTALNVIVGFLGLAQKRGAFAINESAKIYECIKKFQSIPSS